MPPIILRNLMMLPCWNFRILSLGFSLWGRAQALQSTQPSCTSAHPTASAHREDCGPPNLLCFTQMAHITPTCPFHSTWCKAAKQNWNQSLPRQKAEKDIFPLIDSPASQVQDYTQKHCNTPQTRASEV